MKYNCIVQMVNSKINAIEREKKTYCTDEHSNSSICFTHALYDNDAYYKLRTIVQINCMGQLNSLH